MFGDYTKDKMNLILPLYFKDKETGECYFNVRYINRKWQPQYTRNIRRMVREGLFTYHRIAGSKARTKKYFTPGNSYLELTDKGKHEYFRLMKMKQKKQHLHKFH